MPLRAVTPTIQETLSGLPEAAVPRASRALAAAFGRTLLISTLHRGPRLDDAEEATAQDLDALAEALPPGRLALDEASRDAASPEPAMLTAVRQAEGAAPRLPAVLRPRDEDEAQTLLSEASAAGFEPGAAPMRRPIGLLGDERDARVVDDGRLRIGASTAWEDLLAAADAASLGLPQAALSGRYPRPIDAVTAGLFAEADVSWFRGEALGATLDLPSGAVGATDRSWFVPPDAAEDALHDLRRTFDPLYAEVIGAVDAAMLGAAGLMGRPIKGRPAKGRAVVRVVLSGTRAVRAAAARGAEVAVRRRGGVLCRRGPAPSDAVTHALLAACGAARIDLPGEPAVPPPAAILAPRTVVVRGRVRRGVQCWYPRDLSRSLDQAAELIEGPREVAAPEADDGWEALRAALAEALP